MLKYMLPFANVLCAHAQDPAGSWLAYAVAKGGGRTVSKLYATAQVPENPKNTGGAPAFWFGIEPNPALDLLQPIVPKWLGDGYYIFVEEFDWHNSRDFQSKTHKVAPGDLIYGSLTLDNEDQLKRNASVAPKYTMEAGSLTDGWKVSATVPKWTDNSVFTDVYFVVEHQPFVCAQFPANGQITYGNISVAYSGEDQSVAWTPVKYQDKCNCVAKIVDNHTIAFTWDA